MYIPFEQLSDNARIWIYQADRMLTQEEKVEMLKKTKEFLANWTSHSNPLQGSADIMYEQFLILAVEERFQVATGCAVDASIQFIQSQEEAFHINLLNRTLIAFREQGNNFVVPLEQLPKKIQEGIVSADTLTFDNTVTQKAALANKWIVRAQNSWLKQYFSASPQHIPL